jgi:hypothetical protein
MISIVGKIIKDKDDVVQVQEIDDDNLSIDEENNSEIDEGNYDGIELYNDDEEDDDEENNYKFKNKGIKNVGGNLDFDEDIEEEEDEEEEDEEEEEDDLEEFDDEQLSESNDAAYYSDFD